MKTSRCPFMSRLALAVAALVFPAQAGLQSAWGEFRFRVGTMDDLFHYIPGTLARVDVVGGNSFALSSDDEGFTRFVSVDPNAVAFVLLAENYYAGGTSLGQKYLEAMPGMEMAVDVYEYTRVYHQPRAVPVYITTSEIVAPEPYHHRWSFVPFLNHPAILGFQAQVAVLLNSTEIHGYEAFYSVSCPPLAPGADYALGVVIRTTSPVDLGSHNLGLLIDCAGHGFAAAPAATTFLAHPPGAASNHAPQPGSLPVRRRRLAPANEPYSFGADVTLWDGSTEVAGLSLRGVLETGDNFILLSSGSSGAGSARMEWDIPEIPAVNSVVMDCSPAPPSPPSGWTCNRTAPSSECAVVQGSTSCATKTISNNGPKCGGPGDATSSGWRGHWGGSISVGGGPPGSSVDLTGSYSWELIGSTTYTFGAGAGGCGQCKQDFQHFLSCITTYSMLRTVYRPEVVGLEVVWDPDPCSESYTQASECRRQIGPSTTTCDRTCY